MERHIFNYHQPFDLELGGQLPSLQIVYHTAGTFDPNKNNVIWACHSLTSNSNVFDWWNGFFGENCFFNPDDHFIICANALGSCYGTTGPLNTATAYQYHNFPEITIRDMANVHDLLRQELGIQKIHTVLGGSSGGKQVLEWATIQPNVFDHVIALCANARRTPWAISWSETQRMAIRTDPTWKESHPKAGLEGMKTARAIALISYRAFGSYQMSQSETDLEKTTDFKAASYQRYQGEKLARRFDAFTYYTMTLAMDTYNLGRGRSSVKEALQRINAKVLSIGVDSDLLFPTHEQKFIAQHVKHGTFREITSLYGHDGFLIEMDQIQEAIEYFYQSDNHI